MAFETLPKKLTSKTLPKISHLNEQAHFNSIKICVKHSHSNGNKIIQKCTCKEPLSTGSSTSNRCWLCPYSIELFPLFSVIYSKHHCRTEQKLNKIVPQKYLTGTHNFHAKMLAYYKWLFTNCWKDKRFHVHFRYRLSQTQTRTHMRTRKQKYTNNTQDTQHAHIGWHIMNLNNALKWYKILSS